MKRIVKICKFTLILFLIFGWVFNYPPINFGGQGWPQIWNNPTFPPKIQEAQAATNDATIEVLGGGGGGGIISNSGGGGGGGGEYHRCTETLTVQSYTVTVGVGGTIDTTGETDSVFLGTGISMTADGGNGSANATAGTAGTGGTVTSCDSGPTTFAGGTPAAGNGTADAGGGAGGGGGYAGKGGNGAAASTSVGGGGGGGAGESAAGGNASGTTAGTGGSGGGGNGGTGGNAAVGGAGTGGTPATYHIVGGGGGGGGDNGLRGGTCGAPGAGSGGGEVTGAGNGCRGEVRIVYVDSEINATGGTETTSGIYRIHTFTTSGTFTVSSILLPVDTPTFDNGTATYNNDVSVTITVASPASSVICYTTNGDTPAATTPGTCSTGTTYSEAVSITATGTVLKAIGTKAGYTNSAVQSATYTLQVANPAFGTNGGSFYNDTATSFSSDTTGAIFCSTLDGSTPAASTPGTCSTGATGASATVIATATAVKVLGTKANYVNSAVQTSNTFTLTVGAITSIPGAGTYGSTQSVTLSIATTTSAVAHYTTNGDAVTCSSTTYSGAFDVSTTTTVKAIGCKTNYVSDTAISDLYTIAVYSVSVDPTSVNYGGMAMDATKASTTITATVGNSDTKLNITGADATYTSYTWTLSAALGEDQYVHAFTKDTGLSSGGTLGSDAATQWVALDKTGNQVLAASVSAYGSQTFKLDMRTPSTAGTETNLGSQYSTDVTIVASAP